MDCKIVMIEGEEKVLLVGCTEHCRCFKIQQKLGGNAYNMPMYIRTEEKVILIFKKNKNPTRGHIEKLVTPYNLL
jgi:hypothetical protein